MQTTLILSRSFTSYGSSVSRAPHRFYYGKSISGTIWFFTFGLFFIGWIIDLFLIPSMDRQTDSKYRSGNFDFTVTWVLLTFLGIFCIHRFYLGKWFTGMVYLLSGGLFGIGYLYDLWTLNEKVSLINDMAEGSSHS